jgi:hypothetical protein
MKSKLEKKSVRKIFADNNYDFNKIVSDDNLLKNLGVDLNKIKKVREFIKAHPLSVSKD